MEPGSYLGVVRRWWFTLLAATVVGAAAGWFVASSLPVTYRSETRLLVGPANADFDTLRASAALTRTYAEVSTSSEILNAAVGAGGLTEPVESLREAVSATPNEDARLVTIAVELGSPEAASAAADAVAQALIAYAASGALRPEGEIRIVDQPTAGVPAAPQRTALIVALAALGALLGALLLVLVIEWLDSTLRDVGQVRRLAGKAFLGTVPVTPSRRKDLQQDDADPSYQELLGSLLTRGGRPVRSVLVLSASDPADADRVAARLATNAELAGMRTRRLAVDDLRASLAGDAGRGSGWPDDPVASFQAAIRELLRNAADLVVISGGSANGTFAMPLVARSVDAVVLAARLGRARRDTFREALSRLEAVPGVSASVVAVEPASRLVRPRSRSGVAGPSDGKSAAAAAARDSSSLEQRAGAGPPFERDVAPDTRAGGRARRRRRNQGGQLSSREVP